MHARMLQMTAQRGQVKELDSKLRDKGLPMLRQQPGFVDALGFTSDSEHDQFIGISLWKSKEDAEKW